MEKQPHEIIREIRNDRGMTLRDLVERIKVTNPDTKLTVNYLSMIENGKRKADEEKIREIAEGLGVPAMKLRLGEFLELLQPEKLPIEKRELAASLKSLIKLVLETESDRSKSLL